MNPKVVKYVLLTGVGLVWSLIIYRVVSGLGGDDTIVPVKPAVVAATNYAVPADTFSLFADYPDPFLPGEEETVDTVFKNNGGAPAVTSAPPPPPVDISFIQYHGMIFNPVKKVKTALLGIRDKEVMFREKQSAEEVKVIKILPDKIVITYKGKVYTIIKRS